MFAAFVSHEEAKRVNESFWFVLSFTVYNFLINLNILFTQALGKLHQLDIFGSRLVVEYAKPYHAADLHKAKLDKCVPKSFFM